MKNLLKEQVKNFCIYLINNSIHFYLGSMEEDTTLPKGLQDWNKDRQKEQEVKEKEKQKPSN